VPCSFSTALRQRACSSRKPTPCEVNRRENEPGDLPSLVGSSSSPHHFNRTPAAIARVGEDAPAGRASCRLARPDLALLSPPPGEIADLSIERLARLAAATGDCSPAAAAPWRSESSFCKRRNETCFRASREAPTRPSMDGSVGLRIEHLAAHWYADLGEQGRLGEPCSKPSLLRGGW